VHLVGFIIRIYYDARSPERQIRQVKTMWSAVSLKTVCSALSATPPLPLPQKNSGNGWRCIIYIEYSRDDRRVREISGEAYKIQTPCEHNVPGVLLFFPWRNTLARAQASSLLMFLDRKQLDEPHPI